MKKTIIDKKILQQKFINENKTTKQIADELNISQKTILRNLKNFNILKFKHENFDNKNWLYDEYILKNKRIIDIAEEQNVNESVIKLRLKKFNIKKNIKEIIKKREEIYLKKNGVKNPRQNKKVLKKTKKTCLKKFGVNSFSKTKKFKEKMKNNNPMFLEKNKLKYRNSMLKKYGVSYFSQIKGESENKHKQKNLNKYGTEHYFQSNEFKEKIKNLQINPSQTIRTKEKRKITKYKNFIEKIDNYIPLFDISKYEGTKSKNIYKWKCKKCGNIFEDNLFAAKIPRCKKCFPIFSGTSNIEKEIKNWLDSYSIDIKHNKRFYENNIYKYELDIFIPEKNIGIELNGIYWHSEISGNKNKNYHLDKTNYFEKLNIQVIHIWDTEWINKQNIVKSIILNKLGLTENKIYGRQCEIKIINNNNLIRNFLNKNHLQEWCSSSIKLGLFFNNELVSLLTFSKSRFNKNYEYEITRFCNKLNTNVIGGFSKLLKYFINNYNSHSIITYADRRYSNGNLYKNNGFNLLHESTPNYFYTRDYAFLESRNKYQKHKLFNLLENFNPNLTEWENMKVNNYDRIWDCGNYVFELKK